VLRLNDIDLESRKLFIHNSKERKDRIAYMSDTTVSALQQHLAVHPDTDSVYLFTTQNGALHPRSLPRRLVHYSRQCGVPMTAQRPRHTFASQMLAAGMPVSFLQRYLGHEHLDTTLIYAEVSDPLLRQDNYQGIAAFDPGSENLTLSGPAPIHQHKLRQLVEELKTPGLEQSRHDEVLNIILATIE
jgi:integrase